MRRSFVVLLVLATIVGCKSSSGSASSEQGKTDAELIQGNWVVVSMEADGKEQSDAEDAKAVITSDKIALKDPKGKEEDLEWEYKIDPSKNPKDVDVTMSHTTDTRASRRGSDSRSGSMEVVGSSTKHEQSKGIYSLEGDTLKICLAPPDASRPTELTSTKSNKTMLVVLKREQK